MPKYRIYDYMHNKDWVNPEEDPSVVNWKTDLDIRLLPVVTSMVRGEAREIIHYASFDGTNYSIPVVKRTFNYVRAASGLATYRSEWIDW